MCLLDVAFTFATFRNRSQPFSREGRMAVPMVSSAEGIIFGCFKRLVASFRVAGVALRGIQTFFCNASKVVLCGRRNTFCDVFRGCVAVFVAGAALWTCPSSFGVAGAAR